MQMRTLTRTFLFLFSLAAVVGGAPPHRGRGSKFYPKRRETLPPRVTGPVVMTEPIGFLSLPFHYLIVGGGTAGLALAAKLSEDPHVMVGVLEAGSTAYGDSTIETPVHYGRHFGGGYDWNYTAQTAAVKASAEAGTEATGGGGGVMPFPKGKVLGGTQLLDFPLWDRAAREEVDAWETLGNPGWNWVHLLTAMRTAENFTLPDETTRNGLALTALQTGYSSTGRMPISFSSYASPFAKRWVKGFEEIGVKHNDSPMWGNNMGVAHIPSTIDVANYSRTYGAASLLEPIHHRYNLKVLLNSHVTRIVFDDLHRPGRGNAKVAVGLEFINNGRAYAVSAAQDVIVAAGAVGTPHLLELSGIGDRNRLERLNVPTLVDLPAVGENLQDHVTIPVVYKVANQVLTRDKLYFNNTFMEESLKMHAQKVWPSIMSSTVSGVARVSLGSLTDTQGAAELVSLAAQDVKNAASQGVASQSTLTKQLQWLRWNARNVPQVQFTAVDGYFAPGDPPQSGASYFTVLVTLPHPLSRGSVHARSSDPLEAPEIRPNFLASAFDLRLITKGIHHVRRLMRSSTFADIAPEEVLPGPGRDAAEYARHAARTGLQPIGTASMLPQRNGGVVSPCLRVYGTQRLRVVDPSIIPLHVAAQLQATTFGIAEIASQIIRGRSQQYCD